jgi:hypothetical protein
MPDYVLTSTIAGTVILWSIELGSIANMLQVADRPVDFSIFRYWYRPPFLNLPLDHQSWSKTIGMPHVLAVSLLSDDLEGDPDIFPPVETILCAFNTDEWEHKRRMEAAAVVQRMNSSSLAELTHFDHDLDGASDELPLHPAIPREDESATSILFTSNDLSFLACLTGFHIFFGLDDDGNLVLTDMTRNETLGTITTIDKETWKYVLQADDVQCLPECPSIQTILPPLQQFDRGDREDVSYIGYV